MAGPDAGRCDCLRRMRRRAAQGHAPNGAGYADTAGPAAANSQTPATNASMTEMNADQVDLAQRVADLEKALKKMDDKAKADKAAALNKPSFAVGGLIQYDMAAFGGENAATQAITGEPLNGTNPFINGVAPRRLRLQVNGEFWYNIDYKLEVDFNSSSRPNFKDVYFTIKELPWVQNVRIGHFKEPFGLEQLTSDRYTTFMERSMCRRGLHLPGPQRRRDAFRAERERAGDVRHRRLPEPEHARQSAVVRLQRASPAMRRRFCQTAQAYLDDQPQAAGTMRGTWTPWFDEATALESNGSRGLWHFGRAYSYRSDLGYRAANGTPIIAPNYQVRPEAWLAPVILNTSSLPSVSNQLVGFETAVVYGPLSVQGEIFGDYIQQPGGTEVTFTGAYAYVSYFLTGENRPYNRKSGTFNRVKPYTNFFRVRTCDGDVQTGWGAWEVGYRVTYVDMLDGLPNATTAATVGLGRATDQTLGLNWYLNPYTKDHDELRPDDLRPLQQRRRRADLRAQPHGQHAGDAGAVRVLRLDVGGLRPPNSLCRNAVGKAHPTTKRDSEITSTPTKILDNLPIPPRDRRRGGERRL